MPQELLFPDPKPLVERLGKKFFHSLPTGPGVYLMRDGQEAILYIGKAKNLKKRLNSYRVANPDRLKRRHLRLLRVVVRIELQECLDESAALAKESELLMLHKPKFNRAGVWPAKARFLIWRRHHQNLEFAVTEAPLQGWQQFGPFGGGLAYFHSSLIRLLWFAHNPSASSTHMPEGWVRGRFGACATLEAEPEETQTRVQKLLEGDAETFVEWIKSKTETLSKAYDVTVRDEDLDTVATFMRIKANRVQTFAVQPQNSSAKVLETAPLLVEQ